MGEFKLLILAKTLDGGPGTYVNHLRRLSTVDGTAVTIRCASLEAPIYHDVQRPEWCFGTRDYSLKRYSLALRHVHELARQVLWLRGIVRRFRPNVILAIDVNCAVIVQLLALAPQRRWKAVLAIHTDLDGALRQRATALVEWLLRGSVRILLGRADAVVAVSDELKTSLERNFRVTQIAKIYNGLFIEDQAVEAAGPTPSRVVLTAGRLDEPKDFTTLIRAFSNVAAQVPNAELWIAGDGPQKARLRAVAAECGVQEGVRFLGWRNDLPSLIRKTDLFVLSSKREGLPYVLIEAMACGRPVISSDVPVGPSEILGRGEYGLLVPPGNVTELSTGMIRLLSNEIEYRHFSTKALERARLFSGTEMLRNYERLIAELVTQ